MRAGLEIHLAAPAVGVKPAARPLARAAGDGVLDVVVSCQDEPAGMLALGGKTGRVVRSWPGCPLSYGRPGFADVDGDGEKELIAPTFDMGTQAWMLGGKEPLWTVGSGGVLSGVGLADADGDGVPEAYFGSYDFGLYAVDLH